MTTQAMCTAPAVDASGDLMARIGGWLRSPLRRVRPIAARSVILLCTMADSSC